MIQEAEKIKDSAALPSAAAYADGLPARPSVFYAISYPEHRSRRSRAGYRPRLILEHFSRVEDVPRIQGFFDPLLDIDRNRPEGLLEIGTLEDAHAVLP